MCFHKAKETGSTHTHLLATPNDLDETGYTHSYTSLHLHTPMRSGIVYARGGGAQVMENGLRETEPK